MLGGFIACPLAVLMIASVEWLASQGVPVPDGAWVPITTAIASPMIGAALGATLLVTIARWGERSRERAHFNKSRPHMAPPLHAPAPSPHQVPPLNPERET
jgi:hypothetical protein